MDDHRYKSQVNLKEASHNKGILHPEKPMYGDESPELLKEGLKATQEYLVHEPVRYCIEGEDLDRVCP